MSKSNNLIGQKFGRLLVIQSTDERTNDRQIKWQCLCNCGNMTKVDTHSLKRGNTKSCGCLQKEAAARKSMIHGKRYTPEYKIWINMKQRCSNPNTNNYYLYGARGIKVCKRWLEFENFYKDMGDCPKGLTIERIDNNGNYEPFNCKWATPIEQANNRRDNVIIEYKGLKLTLAEWAEKLNMSYHKLWQRLQKYHWSTEKALTI